MAREGPNGALAANFGLDFDEYATRVERVLEYLRAGDCYQINLTDAFELEGGVWGEGSLLPLYLGLRSVQPTSFGAYLQLAGVEVASFSPELHFRVTGTTLLTKPMKGTAPRGRTLAEDLERRAQLAADEKNRAENVMIVDLLRNDMGRLCRFGSVQVPELFAVEPVGRVLQMTSTIRGELETRPSAGEVRPGLAEVFASLFPSGSVTGAPKRRAMEIIAELETRPRGIYTGAIGYAAPGGDMTFSVAIRTLVRSGTSAVLGAGSGIVVDSSPREEYDEVLLKGAFLKAQGEPFELIETLRIEGGAACRVSEHLTRMEESAHYFGYPFDRVEAERLLQGLALSSSNEILRARLALRHDGRLSVTGEPLQPVAQPLFVQIANERVDSSDPFLFHKTSRRRRQERALAYARSHGLAELLFLNERGELTEGAISNIFVEHGGRLYTPPLESGLLPGVGRAAVIASRAAREEVLLPQDLETAERIYLCSSLRGLREVRLRPAHPAAATGR